MTIKKVMNMGNEDNFELVPDVITKSKKSPLEKHVEARLVQRVKAAGGVSWKFVSINNRGVSDRIVLIDGRTIYTELKRDGGKMSPLQKVFMQKVLDNGGEYALVEGMDGVDQFMKKIKSDGAMWRTFAKSVWVMINKFKGL